MYRATGAALVVAALLLAGCSSDDTEAEADKASTAETTTVPATSEPDGESTTAFCDAAPDLSAEVADGYVGSEEHVEDLQAMRDAAPEELHDDLDAIVTFFDEEVDPEDSESQMIGNFPDEINEATGRVGASIEELCGQ